MISATRKGLAKKWRRPQSQQLFPAVALGVTAHETAADFGVEFSQGGERLWPVHQRHLHVQQDNPDALAMPPVKVYRLFATRGRLDCEARPPQGRPQGLADELVVIDQ